MSASAQQTVEKKEAVKDVKPMKPPMKPKPVVPPKPKQAFIYTNSEMKSPLLSLNSEGQGSPTIDIPSAFKISQLTGPQPYGARRTSLKRWSSYVGDEVPVESNTLLSAVENVVTEMYANVTTNPLVTPVKSLQAGSVWKGKSPFMLTTRSWGEKKCQGKDIYESASFSQKHSFNSKDANLKQIVVKGKTVINSSSPSRSISTADHETNVQDTDPNLSGASEEIEKTSFETTSSEKLNQLKVLAQNNEIKRSLESSSQLSVSSQTDLYFGFEKQSTQHEHNNKDNKTEDFTYKSGQESTGCHEDIGVASTQVKNTSSRAKDNEMPQLISFVSSTIPKANVLVTETNEITETKEENPLFDTFNSTAHKAYRYPETRSSNIPELQTVMREEQNADSGYLQISQRQITKQKTEQAILGKLEQVEEHAISSKVQITDKPVTEKEMCKTIPHEEKESTVRLEHNLLYTVKHHDLLKGKTQVARGNNNIPYQEDMKVVSPTDMQSPVCTVRSHNIYSVVQKKNNMQIPDYNTEGEQDKFKNTQNEYEDTALTEEHVPHQASEVFEKQTSYPSEYRSFFDNNARPLYYSETLSAPELSGPAENETSTDLYVVGSQILENDNLILDSLDSHPVCESKEKFQSMEKDTQSDKLQERQLEIFESSRLESDYEETQLRYPETTSQDPVARIVQPEELGDHCEQSNRHYTAQSPILNKCEVHLEEIEYRADESNKPQYTHNQSQDLDCGYSHKVERDDKQADEPVHTYAQSEEPGYAYQESEKSVHKFEQPDKQNYVYEQLVESVQRSELSKEPLYMYEHLQEPVSRYQQPEGSDLKYEQTEYSGHRHEKLENSIHKYDLLEEQPYGCEKSEDVALRDDQSDELAHRYKQSEKPEGRYEQSGLLDQSYEQILSANKYEPSEEIVHNFEQLEDPAHRNKQFDKQIDKYEQTDQPVQGYQKSEETIHKYETFKEPVNIYRWSEEVIHSHCQSQKPDYKYKQNDELVHCSELVNQYEHIEDPVYIQTGSDAKNSVCTRSELFDLESIQQQCKLDQSEEMDSMPNISKSSCDILVKCSEKEISLGEYLEKQLRESYTEELKSCDSPTNEMHGCENVLEELVHKYPLSEEQQLQGVHKEETKQCHAKLEKAQHVADLIEGSKQESLAIKTTESDELISEETEDQKAKISQQILNGHAECGELTTVDYTTEAIKEIKAQEPGVTQEEEPSVENFDFLEGTVVLDSSFMRGRASLGKKRGHRTPAIACAPEEKDPEYWMFRDSTEPKTFPERHPDEGEKDDTSNGTPDNSPSPVKSPNKKGIFAGIISPSLLKGRLKTRNNTTEEEVRQEAEESQSRGKEKPESSSHSLNWLQALKKKKKSTKDEKKKQPK